MLRLISKVRNSQFRELTPCQFCDKLTSHVAGTSVRNYANHEIGTNKYVIVKYKMYEIV